MFYMKAEKKISKKIKIKIFNILYVVEIPSLACWQLCFRAYQITLLIDIT